MPKHVRPLFAEPQAGHETGERIHASVLERYDCNKRGAFEPFPYRPKNATQWLEQRKPEMIVPLSEFEKRFRSRGRPASGMT
jgi:hypothetical protein